METFVLVEVEQAVERVLGESKTPYTLEELLGELREKNRAWNVSNIQAALQSLLKTDKM